MACEPLEENQENRGAWIEGGKLKSRLKGFFLVEIGSLLAVPFNIPGIYWSGGSTRERREKKKKERKTSHAMHVDPRARTTRTRDSFALRGNDIIVYSRNAMIVQWTRGYHRQKTGCASTLWETMRFPLRLRKLLASCVLRAELD